MAQAQQESRPLTPKEQKQAAREEAKARREAIRLRPEDQELFNGEEEQQIAAGRRKEAELADADERDAAYDRPEPDLSAPVSEDLERLFLEDRTEHVFVKADLDDRGALPFLQSFRLLGKAVYDPDLRMWEITAADFALSPELQRLPHCGFAEAEKRREAAALIRKGAEMVSQQIAERKARIYLDFMPARMHRWAMLHHVHYDPLLGRPYFSPEDSGFGKDLSLNDVISIASCRRHRLVRADQIENRQITPGKSMLADAMNIPDSEGPRREFAIAKALNVCAREAATKRPGAIRSFSEVIRAFNRTGRTLSFAESYRLAYGFHQAVSLMQVNEFLRSPEAVMRARSRAEIRSMRVLTAEAGKNCERAFAIDLAQALRNSDDQSVLAACGAAFENFLRGHALSVAGTMPADLKDRQKPRFLDPRVFRETVNGALDDLPPEKAARLGRQISALAAMCERQCSHMESHCKQYNPVSGTVTVDRMVSELTVYADDYKALVRDLHYEPVRPQTLADLRPSLPPDPAFEPLYLVADMQQRKSMPEELRSKLRADPHSGLLCVEDTPENRETFKDYFPSDEEFSKLKQSCAEQDQRILKNLGDAGYKLDPADNLFDGQTHVIEDPSGEKKQIWLDFSEKPQAVISGLRSADSVTLPVGELTADELRSLREEHERAAAQAAALQAREENERARALRQSMNRMEPAAISEKKGMSFLWPDQVGLDGADIGAFTDPQHVFRDSVFKDGNGNASESVMYIPMYNTEGKLMNAMAVDDAGNQQFCSGAAIKGNFMVAGGKFEDLKNADTVIITGDPLSAALLKKNAPKGVAVVAALNYSNVPHVAVEIAKKFPNKGMGLAGASDPEQEKLTGRNDALDAFMAAQAALDEFKPYTEVFQPPLSTEQLATGVNTFASVSRGAERNAQIVRDMVNSIRARENLHDAAYAAGLDREEKEQDHKHHMSHENDDLQGDVRRADTVSDRVQAAGEKARAAASRARV